MIVEPVPQPVDACTSKPATTNTTDKYRPQQKPDCE